MELVKIEKVCTKCGIKKPLADYSPDIRATDKRTSRCKECAREHTIRYRVVRRQKQKNDIVAFDYYE